MEGLDLFDGHLLLGGFVDRRTHNPVRSLANHFKHLVVVRHIKSVLMVVDGRLLGLALVLTLALVLVLILVLDLRERLVVVLVSLVILGGGSLVHGCSSWQVGENL